MWKVNSLLLVIFLFPCSVLFQGNAEFAQWCHDDPADVRLEQGRRFEIIEEQPDGVLHHRDAFGFAVQGGSCLRIGVNFHRFYLQ